MDANEFKTVFLPFREKIFRLAAQITGNTEDAEDITQDIYIRFWNRRTELQKADNVEAYCITLAKHACIDFIRSRKATVELTEWEQSAPLTDTAGRVDDRDDLSKVMEIVNHLPDNQRLAITMREISGFSFHEIATAIKTSEENVRTLLSRARKKVRSEFTNIEKI